MDANATLRILGAVLAGGQSRRFGSDKALAVLGGRTLIVRAIEGLRAVCGEVVVVGRDDAPAPTVPDRPMAGLGPLGGIAGALHFAAAGGFDAVLTFPVDGAQCPPGLLEALRPGPAFCESQPVIGLWPVSALATIETILAGDGRRSMREFARAIGARPVAFALLPANINTPGDLAAAAEAGHGH